MNESKQTLVHHIVDDVNSAAKAISSQAVTIVVGNPGMGMIFRALTALGGGAEEINGMDLGKSGSSVKEAMQAVLGEAKSKGVSVALTQWSGFSSGDMVHIAEAADAFAQNGAKVALITSQPDKAAKMFNAFVAARSINGRVMGGTEAVEAPGVSEGLAARRAKASEAAAPEAPKKPSGM